MNQLLKKKGKKLSAGFYIKMPDNFIPLLKVPPKEKRDKMFEEAYKKLEKITSSIKLGENTIEKEHLTFARSFTHTKFYLKKLDKIDEKFTVTNKCTSCSICEKVCPVENIKMVEGKPAWQHKCQFCVACINYCPARAIEYGNGSKGKERYNHPKVPVGEFINTKLRLKDS